MSGQESLEMARQVFLLSALAVGVAFIPWLLLRETENARPWLWAGVGLSVAVGAAALRFPWSSFDAWAAGFAMLGLIGVCLLVVGVGVLGTLVALVISVRSKQRAGTYRAGAALVFILVLIFAAGPGLVLYEMQRNERIEARLAEMALKPPPPGVSLEEIESRLTRAGQKAIEPQRTGDEPVYDDFNVELVRLWHPSAKLVFFASDASKWDSKMLRDDALLMQAADEAARDLISVYTGGMELTGPESFEVIERRGETRERAEPWNLPFPGDYRVDGPQGITRLFEDYEFRRIVFKLSEVAASDATGYRVYHVYLTSPDGVNWYVVGLKDYFRTP